MEHYAGLKIKPSLTKVIRKYFSKGHSKVLSSAVLLIGICLSVKGLISYYKSGTYLMLFGLLIVGIGIDWLLEDNFEGEEEVDRVRVSMEKALKTRAMDKLNIVEEQASLIPPILLVGPGAAPDNSFQTAKYGLGIIRKFITWIKVLFHKMEKEYDPEVAYMIGSDEKLRSLLVEVSLYVMIEDEILLYTSDVDISTGMIYKESTSECFYQDVEMMRFKQSVYKAFHISKRRYINCMNESFVLCMGGSSFYSSIDSRYDRLLLDKKFKAMRNLIRDKKNAG